jgi:hypothetical protein
LHRRGSALRSGLGLWTRSSSLPSPSATTANVDKPRSMPTGAALCRSSEWSGAGSTFTLTFQRPASYDTVANQIFALPLRSIRRSLRVSSRTAICPSFGKVSERGASSSPSRMEHVVHVDLLRTRNDCRALDLCLNCGKPAADRDAFPFDRPRRP